MSFIVDSKQEKEPIAVIPEEDVDLSREQATAVFRVFQEYSPMLRAIQRLARSGSISMYRTECSCLKDDGVGISSESLGQYQSRRARARRDLWRTGRNCGSSWQRNDGHCAYANSMNQSTAFVGRPHLVIFWVGVSAS
jgi:hypothetical protein